nr:vltf3-like transcription factor [Pandoravirus massiliensis]
MPLDTTPESIAARFAATDTAQRPCTETAESTTGRFDLRMRHFDGRLARLRGAPRKAVTDGMIDAVRQWHADHDIARFEDFSLSTVLRALKDLGFKHLYGHEVYVRNRATGNPLPVLGSSKEDRCRSMFACIQEPLSRGIALPHDYVLYRFFQLLGWTEHMDGLTLSTDPAKCRAYDTAWERICSEVGWASL